LSGLYFVRKACSLFLVNGLVLSLLLLPLGCSKKELKQKDISKEKSEVSSVNIEDLSFQTECKKLIALASEKNDDDKIAFISSYFLGRKYRCDTKKRIKKQRKAEKAKKVKKEADNINPLPVKTLATSFKHLDCMTYVEHVLALTIASKDFKSLFPDNKSIEVNNTEKIRPNSKVLIKDSANSNAPFKDNKVSQLFLNRLIDIMFNAKGLSLMNHHRNHFVSKWAENNVQKSYLFNVATNNKQSKVRTVILNKVKENRTFYVEDSFMKSPKPVNIHYFDINTLERERNILQNGDIVALVCSKEGLDVTHMGFFVKKSDGKVLFRHASYSDNKIINSSFFDYMKQKKKLVGLMVLRAQFNAKLPVTYNFTTSNKSNGSVNK